MKKTLTIILVIVIILIGGYAIIKSLNSDESSTTNNEEEQNVGLANPASVHCGEEGGELEMRENEDGQYGVCKLEDGTECEEWAFFRGECPADEDSTDTGKEDESVGKSNGSIKVFGIKDGDTLASPAVIKGEGVAFENNLIVELRNKDHVALVQESVTIKSSEVGESGPFEITLHFQFGATKEGYVAVYEQSAKDGSEMNLVEIPVKFAVEEDEE